jgi:hypothetical protein
MRLGYSHSLSHGRKGHPPIRLKRGEDRVILVAQHQASATRRIAERTIHLKP